MPNALRAGAVQRLRPKLMTVTAVLASLVPILWESGVGSDVMKPIAAPMVGGMITSTIQVLILVPVFFVMMKQRALRHGTLRSSREMNIRMNMAEARPLIVEKGERLEYITLVWCSLEAVAALIAAVLAGSVALMGFGIDSLIEVASGGALLWRLHHDADVVRRQNAERITLRIVGACFMLLAVYVACDSIWSLLGRSIPKPSIIGIAVTALSFAVMVLVARAKRRVAHELGSAAMNADASQTALCSYLCAITLAGLALNALFTWWWADPVAGLVMVPIIAREGLDALKGKSCCEGGSCPRFQR